MEYQVTTGIGIVTFEGTLDDCWRHLVKNYGDITIADLNATGIKIEPKK